MKEVWIFNPENDLALADGGSNYIAPALVRLMGEELAMLPVWYADAGAYVLAASAYNESFLAQMHGVLGENVKLITWPELAEDDDVVVRPWGWNASLRKALIACGVCADSLPSVDDISQLKALSHRQLAVALLPHLQINSRFCGFSALLTSMDACRLFVENHPHCLLKAPLSGSGKGLNWCKGEFTPLISGWCNRTLMHQEAVVGEPAFDKVMDFAMEFYSGQDGVSFVGYSAFTTTHSGAYEANILSSDTYIESLLVTYVPLSDIVQLRTALIRQLTSMLRAHYRGYLGVDMMICRFSEAPFYRIHPCVEVNMRMNMGVVAHSIYQRHVADGGRGVFRINYHSTEGEVLSEHLVMQQQYPLTLSGRRILSGYVSLVPVTPHSHYHAFILIE